MRNAESGGGGAVRQGEGARDGRWRGGMADVGERDVEKEVELQLAVRGGGGLAEVEWEEEQQERMAGGLPQACLRWKGWRCSGPEAAAAVA